MSQETTNPSKMPLLAGFSNPRQEPGQTTELENINIVNAERPASGWDLQLKRIGPYQITRILGFGGVGTVFEAVDISMNRPVALKVLNRRWLKDEVAKERFLREARLCSMVKSLHVVMVHAVGDDNGVPYMAMELLTGYSLEQMMRQVKLTMPQIIRLAREVSKGLAAAHLQGLIHRDVKPANVWLETVQESGTDKKMYRVKILDFGLARLQEQNDGLTRHGMVVGTPLYMSPEQAVGAKIDARSDLFSLGVLVYQLSTGKLPFQGADVADVMTAISKHQQASAKELNPEVPAKLSRLIDRLLSKEPSQRPPDALNVTRLLEIIEAEEEKRLLKRQAIEQARPDPGPPATKQPATAEIHPLIKWVLIGSLIMNLVMVGGMAALIYLLLTRP